MPIPQQDALEANESNDTPSADQATNRLAGFGEICGKRNALDRMANPKSQPRTSGATPEDASVEVPVDEWLVSSDSDVYWGNKSIGLGQGVIF